MENRKLLIAGIDPGTTTAFAVLDIEGNLLHLNSSKQLDLNSLISQIIRLGKVILVGTDKAKVPGLVEAFAAKLGAKIINPAEDLKVEEKRRMTSDFDFKDEHEGDALASALLAYKEAKILLGKIDTFSKENRKQDIKNKIKELVITKKISIRNAASIIEKKDEESKITEKAIVEKKLNEEDFLKLHGKLKKYEAEIKLIKIHNNNLKNKIMQLEKSQIRKEKPKNENKESVDFRGKKIIFLEHLLKSKEKNADALKSLIKKYNRVMANSSNFYILKKLDTFGIKELNFKNKILNIQRNDILLVGNPNVFSGSAIEFLKDKVFVVIFKQPVAKKIEDGLPFIFISSKNLKIDEDKYFGFVEKKQLEIEKNKLDWVRKIVDDYKKEKEQLIP